MICSKFITFAVTNTTYYSECNTGKRCDLLKIHYLCGDKYNRFLKLMVKKLVVICSKFITFAVTNTTLNGSYYRTCSCDLLKIHYLCGDKYNALFVYEVEPLVVICSKFITFAVTNTTRKERTRKPQKL